MSRGRPREHPPLRQLCGWGGRAARSPAREGPSPCAEGPNQCNLGARCRATAPRGSSLRRRGHSPTLRTRCPHGSAHAAAAPEAVASAGSQRRPPGAHSSGRRNRRNRPAGNKRALRRSHRTRRRGGPQRRRRRCRWQRPTPHAGGPPPLGSANQRSPERLHGPRAAAGPAPWHGPKRRRRRRRSRRHSHARPALAGDRRRCRRWASRRNRRPPPSARPRCSSGSQGCSASRHCRKSWSPGRWRSSHCHRSHRTWVRAWPSKTRP
mmetsp:Transcript_103075/g.298118  ORF Transcript_103075/g.298118 Transcript_103075/m.298118 type:complete len:265 (+) Transcript_103075:893-1687(+)